VLALPASRCRLALPAFYAVPTFDAVTVIEPSIAPSAQLTATRQIKKPNRYPGYRKGPHDDG